MNIARLTMADVAGAAVACDAFSDGTNAAAAAAADHDGACGGPARHCSLLPIDQAVPDSEERKVNERR